MKLVSVVIESRRCKEELRISLEKMKWKITEVGLKGTQYVEFPCERLRLEVTCILGREPTKLNHCNSIAKTVLCVCLLCACIYMK